MEWVNTPDTFWYWFEDATSVVVPPDEVIGEKLARIFFCLNSMNYTKSQNSTINLEFAVSVGPFHLKVAVVSVLAVKVAGWN